MDHSLAAHLSEGEQQLAHEAFLGADEHLGPDAFLEGALKVLHLEVVGFFGLILVVEGDYVRAVEPPHQVQLVEVALLGLLVALHALLLEALQGEPHLVIGDCLIHLREGPLAYFFEGG